MVDLDYAAELQNVTARLAEELLRVPADVAAQRPAPGRLGSRYQMQQVP
jgi:hypothetical protein